jgi:hypothetical protein
VSREEVTGVAHKLEDVACKQKAVIQSRRLTWKALSKYFAAAELVSWQRRGWLTLGAPAERWVRH